METSNKFSLVVGACVSFFPLLFWFFFFPSASLPVRTALADVLGPTIDWSNSSQSSGETHRPLCGGQPFTLLAFQKSLSPHCIHFLSRQKKKKKKNNPNSFLRFLTLPQECRSRNEDVPHVTRGASSTAAQRLKALLPLWDETKSNVDARRRTSWWVKLPCERRSCSLLRCRGCDVGTADFLIFFLFSFCLRTAMDAPKKKPNKPTGLPGGDERSRSIIYNHSKSSHGGVVANIPTPVFYEPATLSHAKHDRVALLSLMAERR